MKVGIVGSGYVGATAAYAMVMQGIGREIVLVDKNTDRALSRVVDVILHDQRAIRQLAAKRSRHP